MKKTVILLMLLTLFSKVLGFIRDIVLSYFYGASTISDVYLISLTIPTVILAIIGKGISTGFIPLYSRIEDLEGTKKANIYTNNLVNLVLAICLIIFIVCYLNTETIVKLFAAGFSGETLDLAVNFTKISLISIFFTGMIYVFIAFLQTKEVFLIPAIIGIPANFIVIGSFFLSSKTNIYVLAAGGVIAAGAQFILLYFYVYKNNYRYKLQLNIKDYHLRKMMLLALPVIFGSSVAQINILVDRTIASYISVGGISALNYANTIYLVVLGVIVSSITTVLYPKISKMAVTNNIEGIKGHLSEAISVITIIVLPATVGYMIFAKPIVQLLYGRGEFDTQAITMTASALFYYAIGLIGLSLREILSNVFYSLQDTKTPMVNAAIALGVNIGLNFILSRYMGIGGLALATSISVILCSLLLFIQLWRRIGSFGVKLFTQSFFKIGFAALIMGVVSKFSFSHLINNIGLPFALLASVVVGMAFYFVLIFFMKIPEVNSFIDEMKNRFRNFSRVRKVS
ncbi:murein biosynthesis integral membrane protein MurJ [Neobacillus mesonae]|uniref:Probable lipid II flippase MurJ n=1 Tax=Neobacillus mesonae TaxID=1193713 RepID=A0A3T0I340_9BACI|nr:murein biosynthesis integral membrane protein MurJ [Neobacillus mesonae]AZU63761.1 murein biosynthesis integral membrane protein MurJ [Neobacillus mesonae]